MFLTVLKLLKLSLIYLSIAFSLFDCSVVDLQSRHLDITHFVRLKLVYSGNSGRQKMLTFENKNQAANVVYTSKNYSNTNTTV